MKSYLRFLWAFVCPIAFILTLIFSASSCRSVQSAPAVTLAQPCALALTAQNGNSALDLEITKWQQKVRTNANDEAKKHAANLGLEQLGWKYIEKARASYDPGYYKLAEACAACLTVQNQTAMPEAMLLRGHALHQMHRFKDAEPITRELAKTRGLSFDYGLLGDVLMEQGNLPEAITAYQKMMDLKPNLQAYSRAAHIRWLRGDLKGASQLALMAAQAGSPQERESTAWAYSRLALYELQLGNVAQAENAINIALETQNEHAPSLLVKGRILLAQEKATDAIAPLQRAAELNPLPEYLWTWAEALRAAGKSAEAEKVVAKIQAQGMKDDPRTFALYLATTNQQTEVAVKLAQQELAQRGDIFTHDALAWALFAAGKTAEAQSHITQALREGTKDARMFLHAGVIAQQANNKAQAKKYLQQAFSSRQLLLPSEREILQRQMAAN